MEAFDDGLKSSSQPAADVSIELHTQRFSSRCPEITGAVTGNSLFNQENGKCCGEEQLNQAYALLARRLTKEATNLGHFSRSDRDFAYQLNPANLRPEPELPGMQMRQAVSFAMALE